MSLFDMLLWGHVTGSHGQWGSARQLLYLLPHTLTPFLFAMLSAGMVNQVNNSLAIDPASLAHTLLFH